MKNLISTGISVGAIATLAFAAPAISQSASQAQGTGDRGSGAQSPEIIERDDKGKATKVRIEGREYDVCMNDQQDGCINPRAAGLDWGNRPLSYWPGEPASSR